MKGMSITAEHNDCLRKTFNAYAVH